MTIKEKLIRKLYEGSCSREELKLLLDLLRTETEGDYEEVTALLWNQLTDQTTIDESLATSIIGRTMEKLDGQSAAKPLRVIFKRPSNSKSINFWKRWLLAASVAAVILLGVGFFLGIGKQSNEMILVQTTFAEQKIVELPDQSIVQLNANSSLRFPQKWNPNNSRQVWLAGEAYFQVDKKESTGQKFQVITKDLTVEVLGTVFNVNARESATQVFLEEGKVNLNLAERVEDVSMKPGELVTYSKSIGKPMKKQIEKEAPASWKDGTAILEGRHLKDIIQKIHEIYDVQIVIENEGYLGREFTVFLPIEDPELGFQMLQSLGIEIEQSGKLWTLK